MASDNRPLSPHLQIYRPQLTSVLSIAHRGAGIALGAGAAFFAWWLLAAASGPEAYGYAQAFFGSVFGIVVLAGFTFALFYHLCNGNQALVLGCGHRAGAGPGLPLRLGGHCGVHRADGGRLGLGVRGLSGEAGPMEFRTSAKAVRGLGSAREGAAHWWAQRMTALALVPLSVWFAVSVIRLAGAEHGAFAEWLASPFTPSPCCCSRSPASTTPRSACRWCWKTMFRTKAGGRPPSWLSRAHAGRSPPLAPSPPSRIALGG